MLEVLYYLVQLSLTPAVAIQDRVNANLVQRYESQEACVAAMKKLNAGRLRATYLCVESIQHKDAPTESAQRVIYEE